MYDKKGLRKTNLVKSVFLIQKKIFLFRFNLKKLALFGKGTKSKYKEFLYHIHGFD